MAGHPTHGGSKTPEYKAYHAMLKRCYNSRAKQYVRYGGRGIKVCARWRGKNGWVHFRDDMGPRPSSDYSLERKDNNGNYEPSNCRWATADDQRNNTRRTVRITYKGKTQSLKQWANAVKINPSTLRYRIKVWSLAAALSAKPWQYPGVCPCCSKPLLIERAGHPRAFILRPL